VFIAHGTHKLFGLFAGPALGVGGLDATAQLLASLGLQPAFPLSVAVGTIEVLGGALLIIGWFTRVAAPALMVTTAALMWKWTWPSGFFLNWAGVAGLGQGIEFHLVLLGGLLCLTLAGAGEWSIDGSRARSAHERAAGKARLRGKV
jgi:putative oxidoreductase